MIKKLFLSLTITLVFLVWLFQNSLNGMWAQTHSTASPLHSLQQYKIFALGGKINNWLIASKDRLLYQLSYLAQEANVAYATKVLDQDDEQARALLTKVAPPLDPEEASNSSVEEESPLAPDSSSADTQVTGTDPEDKEDSKPALAGDGSKAQKEDNSDDPISDTALATGNKYGKGSKAKGETLATDNTQDARATETKTAGVLDPHKDAQAEFVLNNCQAGAINCHKNQDPRQALLHTLPENEHALNDPDGIAGPLDYALFSYPKPKLPIELKDGDQVLIVGDSMQQGVGRHVRSFLSKEYGIFSKNLAKQSTGLISPFNLDWNKTVREEMAHNNKYKAVVMMLGANDSYGITDPKTKRVYPWGSKRWKAHYVQRIMAIMYEARSHGAAIIWILPPNVSNRKLNWRIQQLNELYANAGRQYGAIVISANEALGLKDGIFQPSIVIDGKIHKTRSNDGIHFNPFGEKLIAAKVNANFKYLPPATPSKENSQAQSKTQP